MPKVTGLTANVVKDTVYLKWNPVKYEIEFYVPGVTIQVFTEYSTSREISGLYNKQYKYSARVRAYKWVNGRLVPGEYSEVKAFTGK